MNNNKTGIKNLLRN